MPTPPQSVWPAIKKRFPVGTEVTGVVIARQPFGVFLDLGDGALALMERPSMPWQPGADPMASPDIGTPMSGAVVGHTENNRQVRVVAPDPWTDHRRE
jgi:ribosomal protein S1